MNALLPRPLLVGTMKEALAGRATVLVAPAGYGKTCLASEFVSSVGIPAVLCALNPEDAGGRQLTRKIIRAIDAEMSGAAGECSESLSGGERARDQLQATLADLAAVSGSTHSLLVLEDYHQVISDEVNGLMNDIIEQLPSEIHLIVTSRVWPGIECLPRLAARRQVSILDAKDLAFSVEEVARLLESVKGRAAHGAARELFAATKGWPACVALLCANGISVRKVSSTTPALYHYLAAEVLDALPRETRDFMLETSVLPAPTADLCNPLLNRSDSGRLLEQLHARRVIERSPSSDEDYQYHPLMREFLLSRLRATSQHRYAHLHLEAARILRGRGSWQESVELVVAIEAWGELAKLLAEIAPTLLRRGNWELLSEWLERLPEDVILAEPRLVLLQSKLAYLQGKPAVALQWVAARREVLESPQGTIAKALALSFEGDHRQSITLARQGIDLARKEGDKDAVAEATLCLGMSQAMRASYPSAYRSLRAALRHFRGNGDLYSQGICHLHLAGIHHFRGNVDEEIASQEAASQIWRRLGNSELLARTLNNLGVSHHKRGNHEAAMAAFTECLRLARRFKILVEEAYCLVGMADLFRDKSNLSSAERLYERGISIANELGERILSVYALAGQADLKRLEGALDTAESIATQALLEATDHNNPQERGVCLSVLGSVYRDQGKLTEGVSALEEALKLFRQSGSNIEAAKARFLLASTLFRQRGRSRPVDLLEEVTEIISTVGHDQFILPLVRDDPALVRYAATKQSGRRPYSNWLRRVESLYLGAGDHPGAPAQAPRVTVESLGDFVVSVNDRQVSDLAWQTTKAKEMFLWLVIKRGPALREEIVEALWPDLPRSKTSSYFHSNLHRIRQALYDDCIVLDGRRYLLNPEGTFQCDAIDFLGYVQACRGNGTKLAELRRAVSLYSGPFAPEIYSDWAGDFRRQVAHDYVWVLDELLERAPQFDKPVEVASLCERMLEVDPFHESAWKRLIAYHQDRGHVGLALGLYRRCTDVFIRDLGADVPTDIANLMRLA